MPTGLPKQRQHPGEGAGKCNPERDARPPMFPNQVDPPPQHPWPATSDEGNSVPAPNAQRPLDDSNADIQESWTVLMEDGKVVGRYRAHDSRVSGADVTRITLEDVDVYEVNAGKCQVPQVGELVNPVPVSWVRVG